MAAKKKKQKKPIKTLQDIRREKEKLKVALDYSEYAIEEDWEELVETVKPSNVTRYIDNILPYMGNVLPVSKIAYWLIPNLFSRKKRTEAEEPEPEKEKSTETEEKPSFGKRFKRTFFRTMIPFLIGTASSAAMLFKVTKDRKAKGDNG